MRAGGEPRFALTSAACDHPSVPLEQRVADLVATGRTPRLAEAAAEPESLAASLTDALQKWMRGVEEALMLLAREIEALRAQPQFRHPSEMSPAERAAVLQRAKAILDELGDGSE